MDKACTFAGSNAQGARVQVVHLIEQHKQILEQLNHLLDSLAVTSDPTSRHNSGPRVEFAFPDIHGGMKCAVEDASSDFHPSFMQQAI